MSKGNSKFAGKDWHDIKFFTVQELASMFHAAGPEKSMTDEFLSELLFTSPLVLRESLTKRKRMLLGKVMEQANPWDVVIHDEEQLRAVHGTSKPMPDPLLIQLKEVYLHRLGSPLEVEKWIAEVRDTVKNAAGKYRGREPVGILHLYNRIPFDATNLKSLEELLSTLEFDFPIPFRQASLTVDTKNVGILTWQIYPFFHAIGSLGVAEVPKLKELYGFA